MSTQEQLDPKAAVKYRPFTDPLERGWTIWDLSGEKIDVVADAASYHKGVLTLSINNRNTVGVFKEFRAAIQHAHCNFGFSQFWVNDGVMSHIIESNDYSWNDDGRCVFIQTDHDLKKRRLVAIFPHSAWWVQRDSRIWPDTQRCTDLEKICY